MTSSNPVRRMTLIVDVIASSRDSMTLIDIDHFKSVNDDLKLLERFGFVELIEEKTKNRIRHKPIIVVDTITINFKI